ncbi:MAG: protein kinase [Moorea sp. SIO3I7]|uniref:serine/threonine-protein kinase n=1 Tax=Moorena sp. SIO3I8 TaxID=2607833 RepID=UPI0013C0893F|nr:serine/threonine-protein kinase [Moorena sp. SIO3I8]NEN94969.1 protein kinase [Moorena sp. SIO3I7]NEO09432.1 protein kinase [Moorena sp. SIO3I8]
MTQNNNYREEQEQLNQLMSKDNRYKVVKLLGGGNFGKTWEVDDQGKRKVLKVLHRESPKAIELFKREAEVLQKLNHPGIPKVEPDGYFILRQEGGNQDLHCLVMEKIEGLDLEKWLKKNGYQPITQEQAIAWLKQLAEILALVHEQNWFHRDIKPANIMLRPNGQLALIDFGAVREVTDTFVEKHQQGNVTNIGSPAYAPPEQFEGRVEYRSDFFALGRSFVYLLTGKLDNNWHNWRDSATQISDPLADLINDLMAPSPERRPENAQDILQRLEIIDIESSVLSILSELGQPARLIAEPILRNQIRKWAKQIRIPKIALYGRTGAGKSSLVNAMLGKQVAKVRVDKPETLDPESYLCQRNGRKLEIVDSRGVGEKSKDDPAFQSAIDYIVEKRVDILLFVIPAKERGYVAQDVEFLTTLRQQHHQAHNTELPIILVINQIDLVEPAREWNPPYDLSLESRANSRKPSNAKEQKEINIIKCIKARLDDYHQLTDSYVPVSACWQEYEDTRYNIEQLELEIYKNISDDAAKYGFGGATAGIPLKRIIANKFKLSAAWFTWSARFVPFVTKFIQNLLVRMIANIAIPGQYQSITVQTFLEQLGVKGTQINFNTVAMTLAIGEAAISYFIENHSIEEARQAFVQEEKSRQTELRDAEPEDVMEILRNIDREISERYGIPPLYKDDSDIT